MAPRKMLNRRRDAYTRKHETGQNIPLGKRADALLNLHVKRALLYQYLTSVYLFSSTGSNCFQFKFELLTCVPRLNLALSD